MRIVYLLAGLGCLVLAAVGAVLPVMPSTIFVILAAGFFARSSPRLEAWILDHAHLGPPVKAWRERGAIAPKAKALAISGMVAGFVLFLWSAEPGLLLGSAVAAFFLFSAAYVLGRPSA